MNFFDKWNETIHFYLCMFDVEITASNRIYVQIGENCKERCFTTQKMPETKKKEILYSKVTQAYVDNVTSVITTASYNIA